MQQIYRHSDKQFEVYTTVFSPQACRSGTRRRRVEAEKVMVAVTQYRSRWPKEVDLNRGDLIRVLFKEDEIWWFGRLTNGSEGYFPAACVEPLTWSTGSTGSPGLSEGGASTTLLRRGSVPVIVMTADAPCGRTSGRITPKLLRRDGIQGPLGSDGPAATREPAATRGSAATRGPAAAPPHSSPSLLHRVLAKSRRKSCPHLPHRPLESGAVNTAFQPD